MAETLLPEVGLLSKCWPLSCVAGTQTSEDRAAVSVGLDSVDAMGKKYSQGDEVVLGGRTGTGSRWEGASLFLLQPCRLLSLKCPLLAECLMCFAESQTQHHKAKYRRMNLEPRDNILITGTNFKHSSTHFLS